MSIRNALPGVEMQNIMEPILYDIISYVMLKLSLLDRSHFLKCIGQFKAWDSVVGIVTSYGLDCQGFKFETL
jgi:hypothetical protein